MYFLCSCTHSHLVAVKCSPSHVQLGSTVSMELRCLAQGLLNGSHSDKEGASNFPKMSSYSNEQMSPISLSKLNETVN